MRRQSRKVSRLSPAFAYGFTLEPGDHPHEMHRRSSEQVLEVGAHQAAVTTLAQIKAPDALREAALDARPERIRLFELGRLLALTGGLHRLMVRLGADGELARRICGGGADVTGGADATGGLGKPGPQHPVARDIESPGPHGTGMSLRA